jgi:hypothetical protein
MHLFNKHKLIDWEVRSVALRWALASAKWSVVVLAGFLHP